jgi:hypothetical protein
MVTVWKEGLWVSGSIFVLLADTRPTCWRESDLSWSFLSEEYERLTEMKQYIALSWRRCCFDINPKLQTWVGRQKSKTPATCCLDTERGDQNYT